jgi:hypothetical protein
VGDQWVVGNMDSHEDKSSAWSSPVLITALELWLGFGLLQVSTTCKKFWLFFTGWNSL